MNSDMKKIAGIVVVVLGTIWVLNNVAAAKPIKDAIGA